MLMEIRFVQVGELQCNCYLLEKDQQCLLIDPGDEYEKIQKFIQGKKILAILLTHSHFDHIGCVKRLVKEYQIPVYHKGNLNEGKHKISIFDFEVIYTFGHTMDSVTYYFKEEKAMFTGDFLFFRTIGRCDFLESDYSAMLDSIEKIKKYNDDVIVYPGHGSTTVLGDEKKYNHYFNNNRK